MVLVTLIDGTKFNSKEFVNDIESFKTFGDLKLFPDVPFFDENKKRKLCKNIIQEKERVEIAFRNRCSFFESQLKLKIGVKLTSFMLEDSWFLNFLKKDSEIVCYIKIDKDHLNLFLDSFPDQICFEHLRKDYSNEYKISVFNEELYKILNQLKKETNCSFVVTKCGKIIVSKVDIKFGCQSVNLFSDDIVFTETESECNSTRYSYKIIEGNKIFIRHTLNSNGDSSSEFELQEELEDPEEQDVLDGFEKIICIAHIDF